MSAADARTVWCAECGGPSDVVEEGPEEDQAGREWWVQRFDCGHDASWRR